MRLKYICISPTSANQQLSVLDDKLKENKKQIFHIL